MPIKIYSSNDADWDNVVKIHKYDFYALRMYAHLDAIKIQGKAKLFHIFDNDYSLAVPLIIQKVPLKYSSSVQDIFDAVSPYGYPGILFRSDSYNHDKNFRSALIKLIEVLKSNNICCVLVRLHTFLNSSTKVLSEFGDINFKGETVWIDLKKSNEDRFKEIKYNNRRLIKKLKDNNVEFCLDSNWNYLDDFKEIYRQNMEYVKAESSYFYDDMYFESIKNNFKDVLNHFYLKLENKYICGGLFSGVNGVIQYHLSGTLNSARKISPNIFMLESVANWGKSNGFEKFHLGGGLRGKNDSLFIFKSCFSRNRSIYNTWNLVADQNKYDEVVDKYLVDIGDSKDGINKLFPLYRQKIK